MARITEERRGRSVIPLLPGDDGPAWALSKDSSGRQYLYGEAAEKLAAYEKKEPDAAPRPLHPNVALLLELIQARPDLPVVPMVSADVVAGDEWGSWMGSFGTSRVDAYLLPRNDYDPILFKSDDDVFDVLERMLTDEEFGKLPDSEAECRPVYDALPWREAIILDINTPEE